MASASSCFLLSFCFRKVVRGSLSESAANLQELFPSRNKSGARRSTVGGPHSHQAPLRRGPGAGRGWVPPGCLRHRLELPLANKIVFDPKTLKTETIFFKRRPSPPPSPTLVREGSAALPAPCRRGESTPEASTPPCLPPE